MHLGQGAHLHGIRIASGAGAEGTNSVDAVHAVGTVHYRSLRHQHCVRLMVLSHLIAACEKEDGQRCS